MRVLGILSGKGGVGKTTTALSLGTALNEYGRRVIVVDANLLNPSMAVYLGQTHAPVTMHDVLRGESSIRQAVLLHHSGLEVVLGKLHPAEIFNLPKERLRDIIQDLRGMVEMVILDGPNGLEGSFHAVLDAADEMVLVTKPELPSLADTLRAKHLIEHRGKKIVGIIVTHYRGDFHDIKPENIEALLGSKIIALIPYDHAIREALTLKYPVVFSHPNSPAGLAYKKLAADFIGKQSKIVLQH
ncbi:P-loop NTPase [Candidatus Woesearchaeota archaeon]|nr:P-loop NTPase [Candidatus Woesearchaeota archaeon]